MQGRVDAGQLRGAYVCSFCNQHKGTDLTSIDPETGQITPLFHPRRDRWLDHFRAIGGRIEPLTPTGRATVRLLELNHPDRIKERELLVRLGLLPSSGASAPPAP